MTRTQAPGLRSLRFAFFLSGAAGLGYEIVWTRLFSVSLGHEYPSLLAVVAAFFGGVALGAWAGDRAISSSQRPGRIYALLELLIGLWSLATIALIPWVNEQAAALIGITPGPIRHWLVAFAVPLITLLPATAAMGATLPAIERVAARLRQDGQQVAGLYAWNTIGAAAGILMGHVLFIPRLGLAGTLALLAGFNVLCAAIVFLGSAREEAARPEVEVAMQDSPGAKRLRWTAFGTGILGIGYEVLGIRVMSQVLENTVFSFAAALIAYLVGSAAGAMMYQAKASKTRFAEPMERLLVGMAVSCGLGIVVLSQSKSIYEGIRSGLGTGASASILAELLLGLAVFALPAAWMGASFSHLMQAARQRAGGVGATLGVNTLGSALAPLVFGVCLLPVAGTKLSLALITLGYLVLCPCLPARRLLGGIPMVLLLYFASPPLWLVDPGGGTLLHSEEGRMAAVAVIDFGEEGKVLKVNDGFRMGGTGPGSFGARRLGHLPLLLHPAPKRALFLGVGTGVTFATAAEYPGLHAVGVELLPEVVDAMEFFREGNAGALNNPNLQVRTADARRFVQASDERFDVIIADLFHPARDGSGSLYTQEHFQAIQDRLGTQGLFCQWLPLYQVDEPVLRVILRTYLSVFPDAQGFLGWFNVETPTLGLIASHGPLRFSAQVLDERLSDAGLAAALERVGFRDVYQMLGGYVASGSALAEWAGPGPLNTDDHPVIAYLAPEQIYDAGDVHGQHLDLLFQLSKQSKAEQLVDPESSAIAKELEDYLAARDLYLRAALQREDGDQGALATLLESALQSAHFRTAYALLLSEARNLAGASPDISKQLLNDLATGRPERREAGVVLRELFYSR